MPKQKPLIHIENKKRRLPYIYINSQAISLLFIILSSAALSLAGLMLGYVMSIDVIKHFIAHPLLVFFNTLPLTLFMLLIYFATSRIWCSFLFGGGLFLIVQLINRFKLELRDDPLLPYDFLLGGEVANVVKLSELPVSKYLWAMIVLFLLASLFLVFFVRSPKLKIIPAISGAILCIMAFVFAFSNFYNDTKKFSAREEGFNIYSTADMYRSRGFVYSFLLDIRTFRQLKPEGYTKLEAQQLLMQCDLSREVNSLEKPNVIVIMGEAFYDFDRIPGVKFIEGTDPLKNYREILKESYHGRIVTSVFGGGTSSTEFTFLTGHSTALLPNGITPYKTHIRSKKYSLVRYFAEYGYSTTALHPGHPWFYNRQNVYEFFGFDNIFFRPDMELSDSDLRGGYVRDQTAMEFILNDFERHIKTGSQNPYFNFTVTIENHGPYYYKKQDEKILVKPDGMSDSTYEMINSYLYGLRESDKALGYLISELRGLNEPFVLLYFGDHLPFLNSDYEGYKALNFNIGQGKDIEAFLNNYETPYFIWSNDAAKKLIKKNTGNVPVGTVPEISTCFLAAELQKYIGFTPSPYFEFLSRLKESLPVVTHYYYKQDGEFVTELSAENQKLLSDYRKLQYYMMFDAN
jgi:phosphoglycerol transferase MdoB-like AlkP superfamily enzyme